MVTKTVITNGNLTIHKGKILRTRLVSMAVLRLVHTGMGMLRLIRAYGKYSYKRTSATATGVPRLRLWAYAREYYVNVFTAYTVAVVKMSGEQVHVG